MPKLKRHTGAGQHRSRGLPIVFVVLLALAAGTYWQRQNIHDYFALQGYTAPPSVVQLADQTTMTPRARRVFYVNHPALQDRATFKKSCKNQDEQTIVLGCYLPVDRGIYVFHVTDDRLNGVDQVTAAHEMLHAEYDRLSRSDRQQLNQELEDFYNNQVHDSRIRTVIAAYRKSEPNDVPNEMNSVFGTEVATLTPQLEAHYKQYFSNRAAVVAYASTYQSEFTSRQDKVVADDAQLASLKKQIDANTTSLDTQYQAIKSRRATLEAERDAGQIDAYNTGVPAFNASLSAYNATVSTTRALQEQYNQIVDARNALALEVGQLADSLNSNLQTLDQ